MQIIWSRMELQHTALVSQHLQGLSAACRQGCEGLQATCLWNALSEVPWCTQGLVCRASRADQPRRAVSEGVPRRT